MKLKSKLSLVASSELIALLFLCSIANADDDQTATSGETMTSTAVIYGTPEYAEVSPKPEGPIVLKPGPHLFIDDYLISSADGITRVVIQPRRDPNIPNPIITGKGDRCFQPFFGLLRSAETGIFRIWYGMYYDDKRHNRSHIGYMESEDGIDWKRPVRILKDPAELQFGSDVIDNGPQCPDPSKRFVYAWWFGGGLRIATSPDGFDFTPVSPDVLISHKHDITGLWYDPIRRRYLAIFSEIIQLPHMTESRRTTWFAWSDDLVNWTPKSAALISDNRYDKDILQFYAMNGFIARGGLIIAMVKNLHDDWKADGCPAEAFGIGSTSLAWTRDGLTWVRDREVFFAPDPQPGTWDHAHAWINKQLPVGDEIYLYYGGYKWGHKHNRFEERQIGLVKMLRDRYVARCAGPAGGTLRTPLVVLEGQKLTINARVGDELKVRLLDGQYQPMAGFEWVTLSGDKLDHTIAFDQPLPSGQAVCLEFQLRDAQLFGFDLH